MLRSLNPVIHPGIQVYLTLFNRWALSRLPMRQMAEGLQSATEWRTGGR